MSLFLIRTAVLAAAVSASSVASAATLSEQSEMLCSPEGLARLIPQFNVNGQFTIPDPNTDLPKFLSAQQGLSNAIEMILIRENMSQNVSEVGSLPSRPLTFGSNWLASEVGIQTDGTSLSSPEPGGKFGGHPHSIVFDRTCSGAFVPRNHACHRAGKPDLSRTGLRDAHEPPVREQARPGRRQYRRLLAGPDICSWSISAGRQWSADARQAVDDLPDRQRLSRSRQVSGSRSAISLAPECDGHCGAPLALRRLGMRQ